jgi:autotransporter-associated beta strand protein
MAVGRVRRFQFARGAGLLLLGAALCSSAKAGEIWSGGSATDNKWSTADNWFPLGAPSNDGLSNLMMIGPEHPDSSVDVPWNVRSIQFPIGAVGFSITGNTLSIGEGGISNLGSANQSIANNISLTANQSWDVVSDVNVAGAITGSFGLTKTGDGTLTLSGAAANTYTGLTTVNAGTLLLNKSLANGAVLGNLTIGDGIGSDVVRWMAAEQLWHGEGNMVSINSSGLMDLNGFSETIRDLNLTEGKVTTGTGTLTVMGTITSNASAVSSSFISERLSLGSGMRTFNVADGLVNNDLVVSASIASGGLAKSGGGTLLMIGAANTYSGTTSVLEGVLVLAKSGADGAIKGDLEIGGGGATLAVVMLGANEQIQAVGNTVSVFNNGALALNGFNETIGDLEMTGGQVSGGSLTVNGEVNGLASDTTARVTSNVNLGGLSRNFNIAKGAAAVDMEVSGAISNGGLNKNGPGTLTLSGPDTSANSYIGATTVNQGVLILKKSGIDGAIAGNLNIGDAVSAANSDVVHLDADEQIKASGWNWVNVNASGLFELAGHAETISNLSLTGGNITTAGVASTGMLRVTGDVVANPAATTAIIAGRMDLGGAKRTFNIADGAPAVDLSITAVISSGGIRKMGDGKLRLLGNLFSAGVDLIQGGLVVASDFALGSGLLTIDGGTIEAEGAPAFNNAIRIEGAAAVVGNANVTLKGPISSAAVLSKRGGGVLTISGVQSNDPGAGWNVLAGRVNLNSDAGAPATADSPASASLTLKIGKSETTGSLVLLGANQELASLDVASAAFSDVQGLDLNSPADPGAFRAVRIYATDLIAAKISIQSAIANANAPGAADPTDGIFDSGLIAHPGARIGVAIVNDAHGDASVLIRPTKIGDLNLDGEVTISDFIDLASKFNEIGTLTWQEGDLNYDGHVTISDFIDLASNFNSAYGPTGADSLDVRGAAVPEPGMLGLGLFGIALSLRLRVTRCIASFGGR